ncbi:MAG: hypothetical protein IKC01_00735 [Clostridia bacterium]|nr:hypothetical protein [Clostridia bacterium]
MPYINLKTTAVVTDEKAEILKAKFGKAIENFPGKTEAWLMVGIEGEKKLWFKGDNSQDSAIVDVDLLGAVSKDGSLKMTCAVCDILEEVLGVSPGRVYVKYTGYADWGWNNTNF